jgi:hypothetical protein
MTDDTDPKMDFRYKMGDTQIEGYQITPASRWQQKLWPDWLVMQRLPDETNAMYSAGDGSDDLLIALPGGDAVIPPLAWVIKAVDGTLSVVDAMDMEAWVKVVPVPDPVVHPPADGVPNAAPAVALKPVPTLENVAGDTTEMRAEMMATIVLLQHDEAGQALEYLKGRMAARTLWCKCAPGECEDEGAVEHDMGCRLHSPLVAV